MQVLTISKFRNNISSEIDKIIENQDTLLIPRTQGGAVVVMALDTFNSLNETNYLLGNKDNKKHLLRSVEQADSGEVEEIDLSAVISKAKVNAKKA